MNLKCKYILATLLLLMSANSLFAQLSIPDTKYKFSLDSHNWRYISNIPTADGSMMYVYCYIGEILTDNEGDTILPTLRISVHTDYEGELSDYIFERFELQPYTIIDEFSPKDIPTKKEGYGYEATYTSPSSQKQHQFYLLYFCDHDTMIEFRLETSPDTFDELEPLFKKVIHSIK